MSHFIIPGFEAQLSFRPASYWEHEDPVSAIVSNIKGTYRRHRITEILTSEGAHTALNEIFPGLSAHPDFYEDDPGSDLPLTLAAIHPAMMGGEFLPRYLRGEVEIARIELQSVTADVYSIRARRRNKSRILYRIVDEYPEYGGWEVKPRSSSRPLTFRQLVKLIDTAVSPFAGPDTACGDLTDSIRNGAGDDWESAARFVSVSSHFYPGLEEYYERKAELWLEERQAEWEEEEECDDEE